MKEPWAHPTNWHVDNAMDPYHSRQSIMLWVALDDATLQNGCMYFLPGTHRSSRFDVTGNLNEAKIDGLLAVYPEWRAIEPVAAEVQAGGAVFINGMIAHAAGPNMTVHPRPGAGDAVHARRRGVQRPAGCAAGKGGRSPARGRRNRRRRTSAFDLSE